MNDENRAWGRIELFGPRSRDVKGRYSPRELENWVRTRLKEWIEKPLSENKTVLGRRNAGNGPRQPIPWVRIAFLPGQVGSKRLLGLLGATVLFLAVDSNSG